MSAFGQRRTRMKPLRDRGGFRYPRGLIQRTAPVGLQLVRIAPHVSHGAISKRQMLQITEGYYRDPESGLKDELRYGNLIYFVESTDGALACFVIVDFDHHKTTINNLQYQFTYLGLGCAKRAFDYSCVATGQERLCTKRRNRHSGSTAPHYAHSVCLPQF